MAQVVARAGLHFRSLKEDAVGSLHPNGYLLSMFMHSTQAGIVQAQALDLLSGPGT